MDIPTPFGDAFLPGWANQHPFLHLVFIQWPIGLAPVLFTWLLPALLRYRRGQMAWIGAAVSLILTVVLPFQFRAEPIAVWYPKVHVWLYGIFYVYALAGIALCAGFLDRVARLAQRAEHPVVHCPRRVRCASNRSASHSLWVHGSHPFGCVSS
jgi:hypothetical protein